MTVVLGTLPSEALRSGYIQGHTCQLKKKGKRDRNVCTMLWAVSRYEAKAIYTGKTLSENTYSTEVMSGCRSPSDSAHY